MLFIEGNNCQNCQKRQNYCFLYLKGTCAFTVIQEETCLILKDIINF